MSELWDKILASHLQKGKLIPSISIASSMMNEDFQVWNCPDVLAFQCPQAWESLNPTSDRNVRYCEICSQNVYLCSTPQALLQNAQSGKCVAIPQELTRRPQTPLLAVGRPSPETINKLKKQEQIFSQFIAWWKSILTSEPSWFPTFVQKCYEKSYWRTRQKAFALEILEFDQFDQVLEIAKSKRQSASFLKQIIEKLVSKRELEIALEVATLFEINHYKVISLNQIATELAKSGQRQRATEVFVVSLQTARTLPLKWTRKTGQGSKL